MTSAFSSALPGTRPARRVHVPPPPSGQLPDPGGADSVTSAYRRQQQTAQAYANWRNSFPAGIDPDELKNAAGQFAYTDQALALGDALKPVKDAADAATKKVNDLIKGTTVGDDVASRLAAQSYWHRKERVLDSIKDPSKLVAAAHDLVANADEKAVPVIADELPDYLASRNVSAGWFPVALSSKIPGLSEATDVQTLAARQHAVLRHNHEMLTNAMAMDLAAPQLLDPSTVTAAPYTNPAGD